MKFLLRVIFFLTMFYCSSAFSNSIDEIRNKFRSAIESPSNTDKLSDYLTKVNKSDPIVLAYSAAVEALKAKHDWNPIAKRKYMSSYEVQINEAIRRMPNNMEIRYLRYSIQLNVPSYLGYSNNLAEDKKIIVDAFINKRFTSTNKNLILDVYHFMLESKSVTAAEKLKMDRVIKTL